MAVNKPVKVVIDGKEVIYKPETADILKLKYYLDNPRVNSILSQYKGTPSQDEIYQELWKLDSTKDLYKEIEQNNGVIEPIIVKDNFVLEGNSRLCACRKLFTDSKTSEEKDHWRYIPAIILPANVSEKQIFQLLGTYHIGGRAKWRTFEKASYVNKMKNQFGISEDVIAKDLGIGKSDVEQMVKSYLIMIKEGIRDLEKFSYFVEFYKNRALQDMCEQNQLSESEFAKMVIEDRIPRAEAVRDLPKILKDKKAKKAYDHGESFETSKTIAFRSHPEHESAFFRHIKKITLELEKAPVARLLEELKDGSKNYIMNRFFKEVEKFKKNIKM